MIFNHNTVSLTESHKHLGIVLDPRLDFKKHLEIIFKIFSKTIELFFKLPNLLPRKSLKTIYKSFIRPHMDYVDIIYDQAYNASFHRKLESIQCNAALAYNRCNTRKFKRKTLSRIRLWIFATESLVWKTLLFL